MKLEFVFSQFMRSVRSGASRLSSLLFVSDESGLGIESVRGSEVGSLNGHVVCFRCRDHIVVDTDSPRSVVGLLYFRDGRWRLRGVLCSRCVPVVSCDHAVVVGVVLSKSQHRSPSVSSVTLLSGDERV